MTSLLLQRSCSLFLHLPDIIKLIIVKARKSHSLEQTARPTHIAFLTAITSVQRISFDLLLRSINIDFPSHLHRLRRSWTNVAFAPSGVGLLFAHMDASA
jgi:hypothetical protein